MPTNVPFRSLVGPVVLIWIAFLSLVSLRIQAEGPVWGIDLRAAPDGRGALVARVERHTTGWGAEIRPGMRVLRVGDEDARAFIGRSLPSAPHLTYVDTSGVERTAYAGISHAGMLALFVIAFACVGIGVVVYRWSPDLTLGRLFLLFTGSVATGLAAVPFGTMRYPWTFAFMSSVSALVPVSFLLVTLYFPRPVRGAKPVALALAVLAVVLTTIGVETELSGERSDLVQRCLSLWFAGNLVGGTIMLIGRTLRPEQRPDLVPIGIGCVVGFSPYVLLNAVPSLIQGRPIVGGDVSGLALFAVPLGFAYAILRHRFLALDTLLRRLATRTAIAALIVGCFLGIRLALQQFGVDLQVGGLIAVVVAVSAAPSIARRTREYLDARLYPRIDPTLSSQHLYESGTMPQVASALATRARDLLPVQWTAVVTLDAIAPGDLPNDRGYVVAVQGCPPVELPTVFHLESEVTRSGVSVVVPMGHAGTKLGALVVGARLDGTPIDDRELRMVQQLVERTEVLLELALRRAQEAEEDRYRVGMGEFRRALIASPSREATIATVARWARLLLGADAVSIWVHQSSDGLIRAAVAGESIFGKSLDGLASARDLLGPDLARQLAERGVVRSDDQSQQQMSPGRPAHLLAFTLDLGTDRAHRALAIGARAASALPFDARHECRAREIAEHVQILVRREAASASASPSAAIVRLTRREREIVVLIAQGLTNRQIAARLSVAEGTVNRHVENVLAKLGFKSRVQVATWSIETGLALAARPDVERSNGRDPRNTEKSV